MQTTLSTLFAQSVRDTARELAERGLSYTFRDSGRCWQIEGEPSGANAARDTPLALTCSLHRLHRSAATLLQRGFLSFQAVARPRPAGGCTLQVRIGGAGRFGPQAAVDSTLRRIGLRGGTDTVDPHDTPRLRRATGTCPVTHARIDFGSLPTAGFLFSVAYVLPRARLCERPDVRPASGHPRLWLLDGNPINAVAVAAQAQHHGWATSTLPNVHDALRRVRQHTHEAWPAIVLAFVGTAVPTSALLTLRHALPSHVHCIAATHVGSCWLADPELLAGYEVRCHPLSRDEWQAWTDRYAPGADAPSGDTRPAPLGEGQRPAVLVVDDDDVCHELTGTLLHGLGCRVHVARDGREAIDLCCRVAPALVLMDLDLPVLDGYEAIRRLREMQFDGTAPPCRIVAHSASTNAVAVQRATEAGVDGFLPKPTRLPTLRAELARWCVSQ